MWPSMMVLAFLGCIDMQCMQRIVCAVRADNPSYRVVGVWGVLEFRKVEAYGGGE